MSLEDRIRPDVRRATPYLPGKPIAEVQRELGIERVVKLASNENPLGPSPKAVEAMKAATEGCHLYPEGASPLLREAFAAKSGVRPSQVVVTNGSDGMIRLLCETLLDPGDEVVASQYAFVRFKQQSELMGAVVHEIPMRGWKHYLAEMAAVVTPKTKMVFIASPNNPTGTYNTQAEIEDLLKAVPKDTVVVLDEAYYHYAVSLPDYHRSLPDLVTKYPNLFVLRTFSKAYGIAGARIGIGVGSEELVAFCDRIRKPFNVNLIAQAGALAALDDEEFLTRSIAMNLEQREKTAAALNERGLETIGSATNFLFVKSPIPGQELFQRLLSKGVIVRPLDGYRLSEHVRISIGTADENAALLSALDAVVPQGSAAL